MPRSFLIKKKGHHRHHHYDKEDLFRIQKVNYDTPPSPDANLLAIAALMKPYAPAISLEPLTVRISNGYIRDVISPPRLHRDSEVTSDSNQSDGESSPISSSGSISGSENDSHNERKEKAKFQEGVTVGYTYDAFFITDGRSKKKPMIDKVIQRQRYTCSECGKNYATSSNLSRHKQTHRSLDSQQAKKCPHCPKVYVSMPALSMHILTHDLKHKCTVCGKAFSRPWLLQGHMRSHSGEKPFGCAHCGKAFADRSNLRAHMQTHSAFKHYTCKRCHKSFALKSYLNKHYESACFKDDSSIPSIHSSSDDNMSMSYQDDLQSVCSQEDISMCYKDEQ